MHITSLKLNQVQVPGRTPCNWKALKLNLHQFHSKSASAHNIIVLTYQQEGNVISALADLRAARSLILDTTHDSLMASTEFEAQDNLKENIIQRAEGQEQRYTELLTFKPRAPYCAGIVVSVFIKVYFYSHKEHAISASHSLKEGHCICLRY